ncbi:MAG: phosphate acyltransferase, partial [Chlamydiia bacterium]|nr:phosphate acyltransferase [Chlamydiia bacterium]
MSKNIIGLDLLGGDLPPADLLKEIASHLDSAHLALFGTSDAIASYNHLDLAHLSLEYIPVEEVIELDEDPLNAIRQKKGASVHIGMRLLNEGHISAYLGIGNTGAMLAAAKIHLPALPSKPRPALLAMLPTQKRPVAVLDVGANLSAKPEHFIEMAHMGIAFQKTRGIENPKVALLNIGSEELKGHKELREAYKKLKQHFPENFVGNIEGRDVFKGIVDVLVTEGFTGNIFLKTA